MSDRSQRVPVFDSRTDALPYMLSTFVNDRPVDFMKPIPDPFHATTLTTRFGWRDRLRVLFGKPWEVSVSVGATYDVVEAVLELDGNYRGAPVSARRAETDAEMNDASRGVAGALLEVDGAVGYRVWRNGQFLGEVDQAGTPVDGRDYPPAPYDETDHGIVRRLP